MGFILFNAITNWKTAHCCVEIAQAFVTPCKTRLSEEIRNEGTPKAL